MLTITTSWDDGDVLDKRIAALLEKHGMTGTFYIPHDYWGKRLSDDAIRTLGNRHEVGAHTFTHADLSAISLDKSKEEIEGSKRWLEDVCGKKIDVFCYPKGRYTPAVRDLVQGAGYKGARTTKQFSLERGPAFEMETTVHVYPFPLRPDAGFRKMFMPFQEKYAGFRSLGASIFDCWSWESVTVAAFDAALEKGGVFHLWGHSWEVEKYHMWESLERVFVHVGNRSDCRYVTNGELV
ncbi:polysaccharide deacetylase family protein [Candidatus Kaiserbacteria bacterium]|nr:polysaccharide deacetylase family protein [Candidatus Kaiserbacteria bacterium]